MKPAAMIMAVLLAGCSSTMYNIKHAIGADQCPVPTESEAKITKRVWTK